jgi:hypothetical protein
MKKLYLDQQMGSNLHKNCCLTKKYVSLKYDEQTRKELCALNEPQNIETGI